MLVHASEDALNSTDNLVLVSTESLASCIEPSNVATAMHGKLPAAVLTNKARSGQ